MKSPLSNGRPAPAPSVARCITTHGGTSLPPAYKRTASLEKDNKTPGILPPRKEVPMTYICSLCQKERPGTIPDGVEVICDVCVQYLLQDETLNKVKLSLASGKYNEQKLNILLNFYGLTIHDLKGGETHDQTYQFRGT
ncbi:MAG: hypothetical protein QW561_03355, partial [Candidatus Aenigmatarchaeota archaeon]